MTTTPIARIIDRVRYNCPGALDGIVRLELYNSLQEFFGPFKYLVVRTANTDCDYNK